MFQKRNETSSAKDQTAMRNEALNN